MVGGQESIIKGKKGGSDGDDYDGLKENGR